MRDFTESFIARHFKRADGNLYEPAEGREVDGAEIHRLRMPARSDARTLASGYSCDGDATCLDEFAVSADAGSVFLYRSRVSWASGNIRIGNLGFRCLLAVPAVGGPRRRLDVG